MGNVPVEYITSAVEMYGSSTLCRNTMMKEVLRRGKYVQCVSSCNSMHPIVHIGDCCLFQPVVEHTILRVGDIVFCDAQPGNKIGTQTILHIGYRHQNGCISRNRYYDIGCNNPPGKRGYCYHEHVYGCWVEVLGHNTIQM